MLERVYVETSVVSYLASRPSRDLVIAGHQQITHDWWRINRSNYELCYSQIVLDEASAGDPDAAKDRLERLKLMSLLDTTPTAIALAKALLQPGNLPPKAANDALHIAIAATERVPYLLTWNCRHMANAAIRPFIETVCMNHGAKAPIICTPEQLMGTST